MPRASQVSLERGLGAVTDSSIPPTRNCGGLTVCFGASRLSVSLLVIRPS